MTRIECGPKIDRPDVSGEALRDEGAERVLARQAEWKKRVRTTICLLAISSPNGFTSDDVRSLAADWLLGDPTHPNAWGAAMLSAAAAGLIEKTGEFRKSTRKAAHAHQNPVWRGVTKKESE